MYCMGVKKYGFRTYLFTPKAILFNPWQYILLIATVLKCISLLIVNKYKVYCFLIFSLSLDNNGYIFFIVFALNVVMKCAIKKDV